MLIIMWAPQVHADESPSHGHSHYESQLVIYNAKNKVDEAWEAFHEAALGGTLESPATQVKIKQYLHQARALLIDAQEALESEDRQRVLELAEQIRELSEEITKESKRKKQ